LNRGETVPKKVSVAVLSVVLGAALAMPAAAGRHQDVWLRNGRGERITPAVNSLDPYSPRRTCGGCHGYGTITRGYHFQQGFDEMRDGYDRFRPWVLSPGRFGRDAVIEGASPLVAPKRNPGPPRGEALSTFDWIALGGSLSHPGGGPLEYGRGPDGRADYSRNHVDKEVENKDPGDGDYTSRSTPDGRSRFGLTGVVEGDCLICHLPGYRLGARNAELGRRNYRWAATAGAGLGVIDGAVFSASGPRADGGGAGLSAGGWNVKSRPVVRYRWQDRSLFTKDGMFRGERILREVSSAACLQCHRSPEARRSGTLYEPAFDVHLAAGFECIDCHPLAGDTKERRLQHQIAKGFSADGTVRDDLDGVGMKGCVECHVEGQYRPPRPGMPRQARNPERRHREKFPRASFHFAVISCQACHVPTLPGRAAYLRDLSTGVANVFTSDRLELAAGGVDWTRPAAEPWRPWIVRRKGAHGTVYAPAVPLVTQWFGRLLPNGAVRPIETEAVRRAFQRAGGLSAVEVAAVGGKRERIHTVATPGDVERMIRALSRQGLGPVVFVADRVWALRGGKVVPLAERPRTAGPVFPPAGREAAWFGERQEDGSIRPIPLLDVMAAYRSAGKGKGAGRTEGEKVSPRPDRRRDAGEVLAALAKAGFKRVVMVGDRLYELRDGRVVATTFVSPARERVFGAHHAVAPLERGKTYGAKGHPQGCLDCHREGSPFFAKAKIRRIGSFLKEQYPDPRPPHAASQMEDWGLKEIPAHE